MRTIHCIAACLLAMVPILGQAQENIERMKGTIARTEGVATTNETEKDPTTLNLRSSRETYGFTVKAAKAYSVYRGDNESLAAGYSVGGVRIGKGYDHFVLECFADKDNPDRRYAYALEWNEAKRGKIVGRLTKVYGKRPGSSVTVTTVTNTLPSMEDVQTKTKTGTKRAFIVNGEMTNEKVGAIIESATKKIEAKGYKDIAAELRQEWQTVRESEKNGKKAAETIVYDNGKSIIKRYSNGPTLVVDEDGNLVFNGNKGKIVVDEDGNIVATSYSGKTVVIDEDD